MPDSVDARMVEAAAPLQAGWGWPGNSRKAHYFPEGDSMALCRRWGFYMGHREPDDRRSPDDCVVCRRELDKLTAAGVRRDA